MNKKTIKIILTNIILFVIFLVGLELYSYKSYCDGVKPLLEQHQKINKQKLSIKYTYPIPFDIKNYKGDKNRFRDIKGAKPYKHPVLLVGTSYTAGYNLKAEERLDSQISKLTGRTVYTRAFNGTGPQAIYYYFKNTDIKNELPNIEYIIYPFLPSLIYKSYEYTLSYLSTRLNVRYKVKDGKLVEIKPICPILYSLFSVKKIQNYLRDIEVETLIKEGKQYDLFNAVMANTMQITKKDFPRAKFVILEYPDPDFGIPDNQKIERIPQKEIKYLESLGYIYINAKDLTGKDIGALNYRAKDKDHPNGKAWAEIVPKLTKTLDL